MGYLWLIWVKCEKWYPRLADAVTTAIAKRVSCSPRALRTNVYAGIVRVWEASRQKTLESLGTKEQQQNRPASQRYDC